MNAMSARTPSSPTMRSVPSTDASPSSSKPSSMKNAVAAARSSTTTPTWSIRWIVMPLSVRTERCDGRRRPRGPLPLACDIDVVAQWSAIRDPLGSPGADLRADEREPTPGEGATRLGTRDDPRPEAPERVWRQEVYEPGRARDDSPQDPVHRSSPLSLGDPSGRRDALHIHMSTHEECDRAPIGCHTALPRIDICVSKLDERIGPWINLTGWPRGSRRTDRACAPSPTECSVPSSRRTTQYRRHGSA